MIFLKAIHGDRHRQVSHPVRSSARSREQQENQRTSSPGDQRLLEGPGPRPARWRKVMRPLVRS